MITTNLITFQLSFLNTGETVIFNTSVASCDVLIEYLKTYNLKLAGVMEFRKKDNRFVKCSKKRLSDCTNCLTELHELLF